MLETPEQAENVNSNQWWLFVCLSCSYTAHKPRAQWPGDRCPKDGTPLAMIPATVAMVDHGGRILQLVAMLVRRKQQFDELTGWLAHEVSRL